LAGHTLKKKSGSEKKFAIGASLLWSMHSLQRLTTFQMCCNHF